MKVRGLKSWRDRCLGRNPGNEAFFAARVRTEVDLHLVRGPAASMPMNRSHRHAPDETDRRRFLQRSALLAGGALLGGPLARLMAAEKQVTLPFENGGRDLVAYPQKRPLIRLTARPPQLETPFPVFNEGLLTPNDAFFVRYHLSDIPTKIDPVAFRLRVHGKVSTPLELSLADLKRIGTPQEIVAVNQCSGNSRGYFVPRVNGGQLSHGAMGNARWTGVPLRAVLEKAGLGKDARQVTFDGLDRPPLEGTPDYVKALDVDHALDGEVMLAWAMNGEDLPMLNGYPLRLVVPGFYGTYWVKHVSTIEVLDSVYTGFWMATAYRTPDTPGRAVEPGTAPKKTDPIRRLTIRSFITSLVDKATVPVGRETVVRGIAFDSGQGIREVAFSSDGGRSWRTAELGAEVGRYSFREWKIAFKPAQRGGHTLIWVFT